MASAERQAEGPKIADFDELVDEVLAKKGPAKYKDGLSEENWEEEMEKIPLFMTKPPSEIDSEKAPALAALQDLIYNEDTPHSKALAYKEDGNEHFKKKQYKTAIKVYSEGIAQNCGDCELQAILYNNRAACNYHLGNYRSGLGDAEMAHKTNATYIKPITRAVECCVKLKRFEEAVKWCDTGLEVEKENSGLKKLRASATTEKKKQERDVRRDKSAAKLESQKHLDLLQTIKSRGVTLSESGDGLESPHPAKCRVHLSADGVLVWPVFLLYPEYEQSDYITEFRENDTFFNHLSQIFTTHPPWDNNHHYQLQALQVYYEEVEKERLVRVDVGDSLRSILKQKSFVVSCGTPAFIILSSLSPHMSHFIRRYSN